jgi:DNA-binding NarL/FixJ family response regulator
MAPRRQSLGHLPKPVVAALAAPPGLEATTFQLDDTEYAIIAYDLPQPRIPDVLTSAEQAVVALVLEGRGNADIAQRRGTSKHTVANQLRSIYGKLGVSDRRGLVQCCLAK